jgi:hypothetical protein
MYSRAMNGIFALRLIGVLVAAVGVGALVGTIRRPYSSTSPTSAWATRDRRLILDLVVILIGVVISLVAVQLAG